MFQKMIFTGFSPNLTFRDTLIALKFLCLPWKWTSLRKGKNIKIVEKKLRDYFNIEYSCVFDSGRSALHFALKALGAENGDEILTQAYTCVVVSNAINWTGAKAVYIDIGDDFNMDLKDLEKKITDKSKVLIVQHTFGLPAQLNELLRIAKKHNLKIIEDCAHSFGANYNGQLTGTFGDIGMFSFGSDKVISCVRGGALITNNAKIADKIKFLQDSLQQPRILKTVQHLLHYLIFFISKPLYGAIIGKVVLFLAKKFSIFNKIIYNEEKQGKVISFYPSKLSNALANILLNQIDEIEKINKHRRQIADFYSKNIKSKKIKSPLKEKQKCIFLRYPILAEQSKKLLRFAKEQNIILGDWYNSVIAPQDIDFKKTGYKDGDCPNAEFLASRSVNLPTNRHIKLEDAKKIVKVINSF